MKGFSMNFKNITEQNFKKEAPFLSGFFLFLMVLVFGFPIVKEVRGTFWGAQFAAICFIVVSFRVRTYAENLEPKKRQLMKKMATLYGGIGVFLSLAGLAWLLVA